MRKGEESRLIKLLTAIIVALMIINILIIAHFQRKSTRGTTVIFSNIVKNGNDISNMDRNNNGIKENLRSNMANIWQHKKLNKPKSGRTKSSDGDDVRKVGVSTFSTNSTSAEEYDMKDSEINGMIVKLASDSSNFFPSNYGEMSLYRLTRHLGSELRKTAEQLPFYKMNQGKPEDPNWEKVHGNIRQFSLYDPDDPAVDGLLHDLATLKIDDADDNDGGTEFKLILELEDGGRAVMKPMRSSREVEANPNHYIFDDMERHIAEIAAFQLDRTLGFYRVPPTTGRCVNITAELEPVVSRTVRETIFKSPAGNICFYGECDYYCDSAHAFCGNPDTIEVSMMSYLPSRNYARRMSVDNPYERSYSMHKKAYWERHDDACDKHKSKPKYRYRSFKILLDVVDIHMFDFLTGNKDRHSFSYFRDFGNYSFPILYDNGRGFGRKTYDAMSILAPLRQCCLIRKSTLLKYLKIYQGSEKLSDLMEKALANDPVAPVLLRGHLTALDRRLLKILKTVATCLETRNVSEVVVDDGF